ncbi:MAG: EI24 domain-containing protein [Pseudomonas sp.]
MGIKTLPRQTAAAFGEAFICFGLAFRDSLRPGILLRSAGLCVLMFGLWTWAFIHYYEQIGTVCGALSLFIIYGGAVLGFLPGLGGGSGTSMGGMAGPLAMMVLYAAALALAMVVVLYAGAIVASIRLALRWVLMRPVRERCLRHYPALQQRAKADGSLLLGVRYVLGPWLGVTAGTLLCLLIPLVNGVLLLLLLAYLNVRFLTPAAFANLLSNSEQLQAIGRQRGAMLAFGVLILLLALVPVANLLLPALLAGGACHLGYRGLSARPSPAGTAPAAQVSLPPL